MFHGVGALGQGVEGNVLDHLALPIRPLDSDLPIDIGPMGSMGWDPIDIRWDPIDIGMQMPDIVGFEMP